MGHPLLGVTWLDATTRPVLFVAARAVDCFQQGGQIASSLPVRATVKVAGRCAPGHAADDHGVEVR